MSKHLIILLYFTLVIHIPHTFAQGAVKTEPLGKVLSVLQERYKVQFNYASALVEPIMVRPPKDSLSLEEWVAYLSEESDLKFIFVSDKIISISRNRIRLCGYIKDKDSGETLPYVTVQYGKKGSITNEEGYFEIEVASPDETIAISHIGHKTLKRDAQYIKADACSTLYLLPDHVQLAEIVLYDYLVRGVDKLDDGSLEIDFDKFTILPGLIDDDVLHSVQALPGIQSIDETVSNINIRGGSNDQNLITWDGIKMYQSGHFFGLISMYNPHITKKVELRKNGSSVSETDGVSGTIAMKTEERINTDFKSEVGANFIDANGFIDLPLGNKASLQVATRKAISDWVSTPTYSQYFKRIKQDTELEQNTETATSSDVGFDFYDASFRLLYHPSEADRLRMNFIYAANNVAFNESAAMFGEQDLRESNLEQVSLAGGIEYQRDWSETFTTEVEVYNTEYMLRAVNSDVLDNQRFLQENKVSETGAKVQANKLLNSNLNWANGYQLTETKVSNLDDIDDPRFVLLEAEVLRTHGIFSELGLSSKNRKSRLNFGLRLNYLGKFTKWLWEPRLSANHGFGQGFNLEMLGEFKHQSTSQIINFQNDFLGVEKRRWQLSNNETIPVISSKQISLGLSYNQFGWLADIVPFYKYVDGITTQSQGFRDSFEFVRASGSYKARGIDFLLRKKFNAISTWLSYSYLDTDYKFETLSEPRFSSNYDITHSVTLGSNYMLNSILLAGGLNWRTGKPFTPPVLGNEIVNGNVNYADANSENMLDYLRLDLSAKYEFALGRSTKAHIGLALWNLLNRNNAINTFYRPEASGGAQQISQSSLGFTPNMSFSLSVD